MLAPWKKSYDQPRESEVAQSSLTFCNTMYCSLHGPQSLNFPGKCTGVDCHFPLQMIFLTQGSNPGLPHFRKVLYRLSHQRTPITNLNNILKSRDITLSTKVHLVKAMVFPVAMYGCESWSRKKAEHRRIDAFELWCGRRLLRVPWTARRSNHSILKDGS